jgi:uncharacterized membrane protein YraQ (UPF0718 family)
MFDWWQSIADWFTGQVLGLDITQGLGSAIDFFIFDTVKILILLTVIIFAITFIRSFFPPERTRRILSRSKGLSFLGNILAGLLGIVTPFCSCSAVPLFIGFVEAGIPLGVTFSYLIAAPMVNEVALGMLWGMFGWQIALLYIGTGEFIAILGGWVLGRMHLEKHVEDYVFTVKSREMEFISPTFGQRLRDSWDFTRGVLAKIWYFVLIGIGIGGLMHGWVPSGALASIAGRDNPFAVLVATIIGVPLYSNAAGVIPLVSELTRSGVAMGTALAFMMSVTALSLPEMILLRRVLKPRLLATFFGIVGIGIIITGYIFNLVL